MLFLAASGILLAQSVPAPSGLVGWWVGESNATDSAGINNGVLENGIGFGVGEVGQAFLYDNTNMDVRVPASSSLNVGTSSGFTIECWVNPSSASVNGSVPLVEWNNGSGWGVHFFINNNGGPGNFFANVVDAGGGWHFINSGAGVVVSNVFQHLALTYDKATGLARLYRNGLLVAQQNLGSYTPRTGYDLYLGRRVAPASDASTFSGLLDEVSLYNRALTSNEIAAIYNVSASGKCPPAPTPPVIITQPTNRTVIVGQSATFSVTASGSAPLRYQWRFNGTNIAAATETSLTFSTVYMAEQGTYSVRGS